MSKSVQTNIFRALLATSTVGASEVLGREKPFSIDTGENPLNVVKGVKRAVTLPSLSLPQPGVQPAPDSGEAAKRAMDAADQERRRKLVADPNITGSLGLSESSNVRRSVLG